MKKALLHNHFSVVLFSNSNSNTRTHTHRCSDRPVTHPSSLFIGGVDPFTVSNTDLTATDFVGLVNNVLIGDTSINLGCPSREENTIRGRDNYTDVITFRGCMGLVIFLLPVSVNLFVVYVSQNLGWD